MAPQGPMARFAIHVRVLAILLYIQNVGVAALASLVSRKLRRMRRNIPNGCPAIMPVLAKCFGNNPVAHHQKHQKCEHEQPRKME